MQLLLRLIAGITLDLGFSSFTTDVPAHLADSGYDKLQFTFVDCPGHASLIRTIMGGAGEFTCMYSLFYAEAVHGSVA